MTASSTSSAAAVSMSWRPSCRSPSRIFASPRPKCASGFLDSRAIACSNAAFAADVLHPASTRRIPARCARAPDPGRAQPPCSPPPAPCRRSRATATTPRDVPGRARAPADRLLASRATTWSSSSRAASRLNLACKAYESASRADTDCGAERHRSPGVFEGAIAVVLRDIDDGVQCIGVTVVGIERPRPCEIRARLVHSTRRSNSACAPDEVGRVSAGGWHLVQLRRATPAAAQARNTGPTARHPTVGRRSAAAPVPRAPVRTGPLKSVRLPWSFATTPCLRPPRSPRDRPRRGSGTRCLRRRR